MVSALLSLLGLFDATYLALDRLLGSMSLVCPIGGGCEAVQTSAWSTFPAGNGIPVAFIGVAGYACLLVLSLVALHRDHVGPLVIPDLLLGCASIGVAMSLYFTWLQVAVIGALCFWCVCSALLQVGIFAAALADRFRRRTLRSYAV